MTHDEFVRELANGARIRRPSWPAGEYVQAHQHPRRRGLVEAKRPVSPNSMEYCFSDGMRRKWSALSSYGSDFAATDFEVARE